MVMYKRNYANGGTVQVPYRAINPYTGVPFPQYGYGPEFNWYDYLYGQQQPSSSGQSPTAPQPPAPFQPSINPGQAAPAIPARIFRQPDSRLSDADRNVHGNDDFRELETGGIDIGYNKDITSGLGLKDILGIAGIGGPAGSIGSQFAQMALDPTAYADTRPVNIPGYGSLATNPGMLSGLMAALPGALPISKLTSKIALGNISDVFDTGAGVAGTLGPGTLGTYTPGAFGYNAVGVSGLQSRALQKKLAKAYFDKQRAAQAAGSDPRSPQNQARAQAARSLREAGVSLGGKNINAGRGGGGEDRDRSGPSKADRERGSHAHNVAEGGLMRAYAEGGRAEEDQVQDIGYVNYPNSLPEESFETGRDGLGYEDLGDIADAGRGNDSELAHVTPGELMLPPEFLRANPELTQAILAEMQNDGLDPSEFIAGYEQEGNPETGMPEFGFFKSLKKIGKKVLPVGIGAATSYLTGSDILGGLAGGVSSKLLGNSLPTALITGLGTGVASNVLGLSDDGGAGLFGPQGALGFLNQGQSLGNILGITGGASEGASEGAKSSGFLGGSALPILGGGAGLLAALAQGKTKAPKAQSVVTVPSSGYADDPNFDTNVVIDREQVTPQVDWLTIGERPSVLYFDEVNPGRVKPRRKAEGGGIHAGPGYVEGGGDGLSDSINAYLGDGEYVHPADVVSHLGNGSSNAGSRVLEKLDKDVRRIRTVYGRKSGNKGKLPPKIKLDVKIMS